MRWRRMRRRKSRSSSAGRTRIYIDGGLVGGGQLAWSEGPDDEPPAWLVFGGMIRTVSMAEGEPGLRPLSAALEEEGFDDAGSARAGRKASRAI